MDALIIGGFGLFGIFCIIGGGSFLWYIFIHDGI